ncbi:SDR family oxidoreductase [Phytohabitans houttuyneae]|uniref:Oxidoreductase n=1 Tax=Phytohabitans houttuyneae TaxID=1076126 RepID=A0A6V8K200_9ACTN|nr:SDR family oxidoreductase [Phytohabitans houttuyneae]GFJ76199.1 hypothetical protein Phou_003790 [Phytohabitans houttuyneae]
MSGTLASRCLVTGSSDGIGAKVAEVLEGMGHDVVRHARDEAKAARLREAGAGEVVVGDLASLASTRDMAAALRAGAPFDVVVHNAGWLPPEGPRPVTADGLERTFQVNALSAYLLTALLPLPSRLVYVSSDSIVRGRIDLDDLQHAAAWTADSAYADSKLAMTAIAFAVARRYPALRVNAVHPGWIRTKMSGFPAQGPASSGPRSAATRAERAGLPGPPASEASANKPAPSTWPPAPTRPCGCPHRTSRRPASSSTTAGWCASTSRRTTRRYRTRWWSTAPGSPGRRSLQRDEVIAPAAPVPAARGRRAAGRAAERRGRTRRSRSRCARRRA